MNDDRIAKLSKWAQDEIALLRRRVDEATDEIARLGANEPTRLLFDSTATYLSGGRKALWLPDDRNVSFFCEQLPTDPHETNGKIDVRLEPRPGRPAQLGLTVMGAHQIEVVPHVSNVVRVYLEDRP